MATLGKDDEGAASLGKATLGKHLERNEKEGEEEGTKRRGRGRRQLLAPLPRLHLVWHLHLLA